MDISVLRNQIFRWREQRPGAAPLEPRVPGCPLHRGRHRREDHHSGRRAQLQLHLGLPAGLLLASQPQLHIRRPRGGDQIQRYTMTIILSIWLSGPLLWGPPARLHDGHPDLLQSSDQ